LLKKGFCAIGLAWLVSHKQKHGGNFMAFCSKCGSAVPEGTVFCSSCGSPVTSQAGSPGASAGSALSSNIAAALSYLLWLITGIIFLSL
jgi:hypothetical protein